MERPVEKDEAVGGSLLTDAARLEEVFGESGLLSQRFEGYKPRPGQVAMARAVEQCLREERNLLVEGPTGTGKSLAYLVPAILRSVRTGGRIAVVTANIALQEQLVSKDLPLLAELLPWSFSFSLIKGRNNYLCLDRLAEEQDKSSFKHRRVKGLLKQYRDTLKWAKSTKDGDKSELPFEPDGRVWGCFAVTADECKGQDCRSFADCHAEKAKKGAEDADIFVTNYHMLFADLSVKAASGGTASVLPEYDYVICDEAHKAADIARDFFGFRVTEASVRFASRLLGRLNETELYDDLESQATEMFYDLKKLYRSGSYKTRFKKPPENIRWEPLRDTLHEIAGLFGDASEEAADKDERASFRKAATTASRMAENISQAMSMSDQNMVYFLEELSNGAVALKGKPISASALLRDPLFGRCRSVVLTSATLAVGGGFRHVIDELGVPDPKQLVVESPFDFRKQALLIVPDGMPPPTAGNYPGAVAAAVSDVIKLAGGRTLGLFTSYRNLSVAHEKALSSGFTVMRQGEMPRMTLVERFRKDEKSVLLGTESFWAGVDVPGSSLSCVVIDRLPFPTPDDPVLDALTERHRDWFMRYSVPRAIIAFKQGFGRLIRSVDDRGVVVVLDQRIATKSYGHLFLNSLPPVPKSRKMENVRKFLWDMEPKEDRPTAAKTDGRS